MREKQSPFLKSVISHFPITSKPNSSVSAYTQLQNIDFGVWFCVPVIHMQSPILFLSIKEFDGKSKIWSKLTVISILLSAYLLLLSAL